MKKQRKPKKLFIVTLIGLRTIISTVDMECSGHKDALRKCDELIGRYSEIARVDSERAIGFLYGRCSSLIVIH